MINCALNYFHLFTGITQEQIDECRAAKERAMLNDVQALIDRGDNLSAKDQQGATLVRERETDREREKEIIKYAREREKERKNQVSKETE